MSERRQITGKTEHDRHVASPTRKLNGRRERDSQRARVYRAEHRIHGPLGRIEQDTLTFPEVVEAIRQIEKTRWFQWSDNWVSPEMEEILWEATRDYEVTVGDGRSRKTGCAVPALWEIRIPRGFRCVEVLVHEMAHLIVPPPLAGHGPDWVETYLDGLAAVGMGGRAHDLAKEFARTGVVGGRDPDYYLTVAPEIDLLVGRQAKAEEIRLMKDRLRDIPFDELTPEMLTLAA